MITLSQRIHQLIEKLCEGIYEREEVIKLALLTAIAGESIFLIGPPGVAKSLVARKLKFAFQDGKAFEYLMSKFSTPDEIFGPVSIRKLKDNDKYERLTERYLPGANIVFLDEIWKAGPAIQNALLTILNEKIYRNGETDVATDIKIIISASNELPTRGEGLEALWDRFLVRYEMTEIRRKSNFISMITATDDVYVDTVPESLKITNQELEIWNENIQRVIVPEEVINVIQVVKHKLHTYKSQGISPFEISDRRWKKIVRLLRTSAFLNERTFVNLMDCFLMVHCLWSDTKQIEIVQEIVAETIRKHGYSVALNLSSLRKEIAELEEEVKKECRIPVKTVGEILYLVEKKYYEILHISKFFDGKYVKADEYEQLRLDEFTTIGLYDENFKLTYKIKAKRTPFENRIEIFHNSQSNVFEMKTEKTDTVRYIEKKPHIILQKYWNEKIETLSLYIEQIRKQLKENTPPVAHTLRSHLFVPSELAEIVEANLYDVMNTIHAEGLRLEKIKFYYENIQE
ncbi:MAG: AAA family ATPase [Cytophagales bacterium]|nr:AAA family ATPase [Cytophagales bacterium]MDW8385053.1 AAA family ATPase [Flammeovirgaceae bacterium]